MISKHLFVLLACLFVVMVGFPGLAILCFLAAAAGSFWLVISIFVSDYRNRKKYTR